MRDSFVVRNGRKWLFVFFWSRGGVYDHRTADISLFDCFFTLGQKGKKTIFNEGYASR